MGCCSTERSVKKKVSKGVYTTHASDHYYFFVSK
jgi:hypothetical protein